MLQRGLCSSSQKAKSQTRLRKQPSRRFWHLPSYLAPGLLPPSPPADCTHALVKPSAAHTNMISAQNMRTPRKPGMTTVFIWSVSKLPWPTVNKHFLDAGVSEMSFFGQTRCGWPRRCALRVNEDTASLVQALFCRRRHQPSRPARTVVCSMRDFEPRLSQRVQKIKLCATWVVVPNF